MDRAKLLKLYTVVMGACLSVAAHSGGEAQVDAAHKHGKKMKMNEPMTSGMAKAGMMKGDVKSAGEKKAKEMHPMMEQEQKAMPPEAPKR